MMRIGVAPAWRLRHSSENKGDVVMPLAPRLLNDDMVGVEAGCNRRSRHCHSLGYVCCDDFRSGALRRVLPEWIAGDSTLTAPVPYRQGPLPFVRAFLDHLAAEFPKVVLM
jgi:hypothetical protein